MNNENKKFPTRFPNEMPAGDKKSFDHGAIESVVRNEIDIKFATNPAKPHNTDSLNTEFAKEEAQRSNK